MTSNLRGPPTTSSRRPHGDQKVLVIKGPSGTQYSRYDIVSVLRRALLVSFIPQRVCDHALSTVCVVKLAEVTLGQKLITTKKWITDLCYSPAAPYVQPAVKRQAGYRWKTRRASFARGSNRPHTHIHTHTHKLLRNHDFLTV